MIKVAAVVPPASLNLGNDFFSMGGITAFKKAFPDTEVTLIEFFDSGERGFINLGGQSPFFTPATLQWIKDKADLVVLFGGCCLHSGLKHLFDPLFSTGVPFVGWGLSPTSYNNDDVEFAKYVADQSLLLITRDDIIAQMVGEYPNFMSGMDGGWWMGESYNKPDKSLPYSIVNVESNNNLDRQKAIKIREDLLSQDPNVPVYYVSNNCERNFHFMNSNSLLITSAEHLYSTLANASFVVTTRAHSTICCLTNKTKVKYQGGFSNRVKGLMKTVGIDITNSADIENPLVCYEKIVKAKNNFIEDVRDRLKLPESRS